MRIEPEISGVNVVLLGDFNPAIFTPAWFALHGLLPESVADSAELHVAHQQGTEFVAEWLRLQVTVERFSVETLQAPHIRLRDLVVRIFKEHLHHTPLRAFGINSNVHFRVQSLTERDRIGRALAPVEPWGAWGQDLGLDEKQGGMTSLTMSQVAPQGRPKGGQINVTVEPSYRIGKGRTGVYVRVNDHYAIDNAGLGTAERLIELFEDNFDTSLERGNGIIDHIMSLAETKEE
ncbi:MAG: hypothetical protein OXI58_05965 [Gemmatimonadota bacterium]|nr:hypothetical protein [Gemmatimonadota bacterium]